MKQKNLALLCVATFVALQLSSCAALTRYRCNREYAAKKGMEDADAGKLAMPSRLDGSSCEGEYSPSDFSKDYNYGFQSKKAEICQVATAVHAGRADGEAGNSGRPQKAKFGLCQDRRDLAKIEAAYETEFKKAFCAPARAAKLGSAQAQSWQLADFETPFHDCPGSKTLRTAYMNAYKEAMTTACTVAGAEQFAAAEAHAKRPMEAGKEKLAHCAAVGKPEVQAAFARSYQATQANLAKAEADRAAAEQERLRQAKLAEFHRTVATTNFPFQLRNYLSRCSVAGDRSFVQVEVENQYPEQVLIQGNWKFSYYNQDFAKITEDRTLEAVLVTGNNKKTFQKLTLPREAVYCRADFVGGA